jgi:hypothetical protein
LVVEGELDEAHADMSEEASKVQTIAAPACNDRRRTFVISGKLMSARDSNCRPRT